MKQILRRLGRIINANKNSSRVYDDFDDYDKTLKEIIDELNQEKNAHSKEDAKRHSNENAFNTHKEREPQSGKLSQEQAYRILDVKPDVSDEALKEAYRKKIREYHPDRVATMGEDIKELALKKSRDINEAYTLLKKIRKI